MFFFGGGGKKERERERERSLHEQSARQVSNSQPGATERQVGGGGSMEMSQSSLAMGRSSDEGIESMM